MFYAALICLTRAASPEGYRLVRMLCSYLQLDSLIGLNIHTESTLTMIEEELLVFDKELKVGLCTVYIVYNDWHINITA